MTGPATRDVLADATARLTAAGLGSPRVDAELLLTDLLDIPRAGLLTRGALPRSVAEDYAARIARRIAREPLQHITGRAWFRHVEVAVGPGVFVPRPETELLVDAVLPHLRTVSRPAVVDLCSGSGALALAIADEVPSAGVIAVEYSFAAQRWLTPNVAGTRVRAVIGDLRDPELLRSLYGQADAVVANPPYVPLPTEVEPEVLADPRDAVFSGVDGLDLMPTVISRAAHLCRSGAIFAVEHDDSQGDAVPELLAADGRWTDIWARRDLAGRPRYAVATRR